jgi:hypothetical protein
MATAIGKTNAAALGRIAMFVIMDEVGMRRGLGPGAQSSGPRRGSRISRSISRKKARTIVTANTNDVGARRDFARL